MNTKMLSLPLRPLRHRLSPTFNPLRRFYSSNTTPSSGGGGKGALLGGGALILTMGAYIWNNINESKAVANLEINDNGDGGDNSHNKTPTGKKMS